VEDDTYILLRRIGPPVAALAAVEAALYLLLDRSDTRHDLYRSPALIALVVGVMATAIRMRGRLRGDRRHSETRRDAGLRDAADRNLDVSAPDADDESLAER
jgi:hypothetical protein